MGPKGPPASLCDSRMLATRSLCSQMKTSRCAVIVFLVEAADGVPLSLGGATPEAAESADCVRMRQMKGHGSKFGRKKEEAIRRFADSAQHRRSGPLNEIARNVVES